MDTYGRGCVTGENRTGGTDAGELVSIGGGDLDGAIFEWEEGLISSGL